MKPINWRKTKARLADLPNKELHALVKLARKELFARHTAEKGRRDRLTGGFAAMANFMAGATWAMACRQALRESKDLPGIGKRAAAGDMWLPREMLTAVRHQVKDRGWHPLTARSWGEVLDRLSAEAGQRPGVSKSIHLPFPSFGAADVSPTLKMERFCVKMAEETAAATFSDRFDYGGES